MRESHCFYGCRNAFLPFGKQNMNRAGAIPVCFTGVGTRHYHSRNQIGAAHCSGTIPDILRVQERTVVIRRTIYKPPKRKARRRRKFLGFYATGYGHKLYFCMVLRCFLSPFLKVFGHFGSPKSQKFRLRRADFDL